MVPRRLVGLGVGFVGCLAVAALLTAGGGRSVSLFGDENVVGSLGVQADDSEAVMGSLGGSKFASSRDDVNVDGVLGSATAVSSGSHSAKSMKMEMNSFFDNLPTHDVQADHAAVQADHAAALHAAVSVAPVPASRWGRLDNANNEWEDKMKNMEAAVKIAQTKGDAALEEAIQNGLTQPGGESTLQGKPALHQSDGMSRHLAHAASKLGGVDGARAKHMVQEVSGLRSSLAKEHSIMARLKAEVAERNGLEAQQGGAASVLPSAGAAPHSLQKAPSVEEDAHLLAASVNPQPPSLNPKF